MKSTRSVNRTHERPICAIKHLLFVFGLLLSCFSDQVNLLRRGYGWIELPYRSKYKKASRAITPKTNTSMSSWSHACDIAGHEKADTLVWNAKHT